MRTIRWTSAFKADYKRLKRSPRYRLHAHSVLLISDQLTRSTLLDSRYNDHALTGDWNKHRKCHLAPDLLLIYRYDDEFSVTLVRLGTHSELFR